MAVATKTTRTQAETDIQGVGLGSLADGVSIGPYEVVRFLGRGGMGEVYEVLHTLLGKRFALKLISKELSQDEKARNLFRREGREAGNLDHPNIVRVDDCGEVDGRMYLRMELIEGRPCGGDTCVTLTDYIIACSLRVPPKDAIPILHDILRGLNYAHSRRRVHRDIKPSNILMTPQAAKIGDFGLVMSGARPGGDMSQMSEVVVMGLGAQSMMNATQTSGASAAAGTPDYMAPELLSGSVEANYSTDVYSVGILLLEMLTGSRRVGAAKPSQLLRSHYKLDPWWDQLYERSTAYHEDRFANAGEMLSFFIEVSGQAKAEPAPEVESKRPVAGPATTRLPANWGNVPAAAPSVPLAPESSPAQKPTPEPPRVASKLATPPPPAPERAPSPVQLRESGKSTVERLPPKAKRGVPWVPLAAGGAAAVLGVSLYLVKRKTVEPPMAIHPPGETNVSLSKPEVPVRKGELVAPTPSAAPSGVRNGVGPGAAGVKAPTNAPERRLIKEEQQKPRLDKDVQQALKDGRLEDAWKLVSTNPSLAGDALYKSVRGAHQAAEKVADGIRLGDVERLKEALVVWQEAKTDTMGDPEIISKARDLVGRSTSDGKQQFEWRAELKKAIENEDVLGIRRFLAVKKYETDSTRFEGERKIKSLEDASERLRGRAREAIKKGDFATARLELESLNQHLKRTKQEPDSQLDGEIGAAQRVIMERKVEKAVMELNRYTPSETPPSTSADPEVIRSSRYKEALASALARQAAWKIDNAPKPTPKPVDAVDLAPAPKAPVTPSPSPSEPQSPQSPPPPDAASTEKRTFEALKTRINGLGNRGIPQQTKQDMMTFLKSYQKSHPEDDKEATRLIENLRNR